jgi:hypothetical protein
MFRAHRYFYNKAVAEIKTELQNHAPCDQLDCTQTKEPGKLYCDMTS